MDTLLEHVFTPDSYQNTFELVNAGDETLLIAEGKTKQQFMEWIHRLPSTNPPSWMGLPRSAETMVLISQGNQTLRNLQLMQDFYGSETETSGTEEESMVLGTAAGNNGGDESMGEDTRPKWVQDLDRRVDAWLSLFPGSLPALSRDPGNFSNPIYRCMFREVELGSEYLATVTGLLSTIKAVCAYTTKPTNDIREAMQTLYREKIPSQWLRLYRVAAELSLSEWLADFSLRVRQLDQLARIAPDALLQTQSGGIWLGGLFSPEAFVTAARQSVAAALTCSLDELELIAEIQPTGQIGSFGVSGLQLEGASWTSSDILPSDIIRNNLSLLHLRWSRASELANQTGYRRLPVYSSTKRDHLLFSVSVQVDSAKFPTTQWIQRSIALVLWQLTA
jgi:dynein heavy chain 1